MCVRMARFTFNREWDAAELSFAKFTAQVTRKNSDIIGLPVVCSRLFRFSSFYVNRHSKIETAADLKGKSIGSPEWAHTAAVYMRGWLGDEAGVKLQDVHWFEAGTNEPGRTEWEGFRTATRAAAAGGFTTVIDMPLNCLPETTNVAALEAKRDHQIEQAKTDKEKADLRAKADLPIDALVPFIDWTLFFAAWELKGRFPAILEHPT